MAERKQSSASEYLPERIALTTLREAVQDCRGCDLFRHATQAVFGEGLKRSRIMLIGEQPGDQEDKQGRPFVGPAGRLLDRALVDASIDRDDVFLTNAVKHFKWTQRGKRRIHSKPSARETAACRPWLEAEIEVVRPQVLVALGATAAGSLFGSSFRVTRERGRFFESAFAPHCMGTVHPSSILREIDEVSHHAAYRDFVADLQAIATVFD